MKKTKCYIIINIFKNISRNIVRITKNVFKSIAKIIISVILYIVDIFSHKFWVFIELNKVIIKLLWRSIKHDISKFTISESHGFIKYIDELKNSEYESKKYNKILYDLEFSLDKHYERNSHHPEHYNYFGDMDIYDLIEMVCDWKASTKRYKNGSVLHSFNVNKKRFKIKPEILKLLKEI